MNNHEKYIAVQTRQCIEEIDSFLKKESEVDILVRARMRLSLLKDNHANYLQGNLSEEEYNFCKETCHIKYDLPKPPPPRIIKEGESNPNYTFIYGFIVGLLIGFLIGIYRVMP